MGQEGGRDRPETREEQTMVGREDTFRSRAVAGPALSSGSEHPSRFVSSASSRRGDGVTDDDLFFQRLVESGPQTIVVLDRQASITYASQGVLPVLGYRPAELVGRSALKLVHPEDARVATVVSRFDQLVELPDLVSWSVYRVRHKCGTWRRIESLVKNCLDDPAIGGIVVSSRRVARQKHLQQRVRRYRQMLRDLTCELTLSEEHQRQCIAADLHDDLAQSLTLAKMKVDALRSAEPGDVAASLDAVSQLIGQAARTTRGLASSLSPPVPADQDLVAALLWLAEQMARDYGLIVQTKDDGRDKPLDGECRIVLFRAVRELLVNIAKHAGVHRATVTLGRTGNGVRITVTDDGNGFDVTQARSCPTSAGGFGLADLGRRLECLGGSLEVQSVPDEGTRVTLVAPLANGEPSPASSRQEDCR